MTSKRTRAIPWAAFLLVFALSHTARAIPIVFTIDTTGSGTGLTPIANTAGNIGKYNAGSWLTLGGGFVGSNLGGMSVSGNFTAQKAAAGAFSTGNPGSLVSYLGGSIVADIDVNNSRISFPGGSEINATNYNALYPQASGPAIPLSPAIGGGTSTTTPGADLANYGTNLKLTALGGLFTTHNGTTAVRDLTSDVTQATSGATIPLSGAGLTQTFVTKSNLYFHFNDGDFDYNLKGNVVLGNTMPDLIGTTSLDWTTTTPGITTGGVGTLTRTVIDPIRQIYSFALTVPITATITALVPGDTPLPFQFTSTGQVAAHGFNVQIPEPATIILLGSAAGPLGFLAWRRRRRLT